ncbi:MAG: Nramp family divalent metal transporter [Planctomycetota bacterium]
MAKTRVSLVFAAIGPGILVAATGVGAGDVLTAGLGGSAVGLAVLWAAVVGAFIKWFLSEGVGRWQMATGKTVLEGWFRYLGKWIQWVFLVYLLVWSFLTGGALINACGVAGAGLFPFSDDMVLSKIIWGVIHSLAGLVLVLVGGFRLFEKLMSVFIGLMFVTVVATMVLIQPDFSAVGKGMILPTIPSGGLGWVLGILGGVGGTVTLLSYGYWIREGGRSGIAGIKACRLDLTLGYVMTGLFGLCMIVIGSEVQITGKGATVALDLADQLAGAIGPLGKWIFLVGFWGAVFSSLLGVWQSIPYMFVDFLTMRSGLSASQRCEKDFTRMPAYRVYLLALALVPLPLLWISVQQAQLIYAVMGSLFMPFLALTLLIMNNRSDWVGKEFRSGWITNVVLAITLLFFICVGIGKIVAIIGELIG